MEHILPLAKVLLGGKVRLAAPRSSITADSAISAMDANASTAVGLVIEAAAARLSYAKESHDGQQRVQPRISEAPRAGRNQERGSLFNGFFNGNETETEDDDPVAKADERRRLKEEEERRKAEEKARKEEEKRRKEEERKRKEAEKEANRKSGGIFGDFFGGLFNDGNDNA